MIKVRLVRRVEAVDPPDVRLYCRDLSLPALPRDGDSVQVMTHGRVSGIYSVHSQAVFREGCDFVTVNTGTVTSREGEKRLVDDGWWTGPYRPWNGVPSAPPAEPADEEKKE